MESICCKENFKSSLLVRCIITFLFLLLNLRTYAQQFQNGSFTDGASGWRVAAAFHCNNNGQFKDYNTGPGYAYFAADDGSLHNSNKIEGTLSQDLILPANFSSGSIRFFQKITTEEDKGIAYDKMSCTATDDADGANTRSITLTNLDAGNGYTLKTIDLPKAMAGHTITLTFYAKNDNGKGTVFRIDDITLVTNSTSGGTPSAPVITAPSNNSTQYIGGNIHFSWTTVNNAQYQAGFDLDKTYKFTPSTNENYYDLAAVTGGLGSHTFQVRSVVGGVYSAWSVPVTYTVSLYPPALSSPTTGATQYVGTSVNFQWVPVSGASGYDLRFDDGLSYVATIDIGNFEHYLYSMGTGGLGAHTWQVRAKFNGITGPWSEVRTYTNSLFIPVPNSPLSGSTIAVGADLKYTWTEVSGADSYEIDFDSGTNYATTESVGTNVLSRLVDANQIGTHTWRVKAKFKSFSGPLSPPYNYTVVNPQIKLLNPKGGENFIIGTTQMITWETAGFTGNVKIEINGEYPSNPWETIFSNISNNGSVNWTVSGFPGTEKRIRVTSIENPGISGVSADNFEIVAKNKQPGLTILVHGFDPFGSFDNPVSYWPKGFVTNLLAAQGGGKVYVYQASDGSFKQITDNKDFNALTNGPETILLMDWLNASNNPESGEAESAADALFASLVSPDGSGEPNTKYISLANPAVSLPIHLIGHSRGCVVISELAQRLGVNGIKVNYFTSLDPHDFDEEDVSIDGYFHDPAVQIWNNVIYADNYWQRSLLPEVPSGRKLAWLSNDGYLKNQYELTPLNLFGNNLGTITNNSHGKVKNWYQGTILNYSQEVDWYQDQSGAGAGMSKWLAMGGYSYRGTDNGINDPADPIKGSSGNNSSHDGGIVPYKEVSSDGSDQNYNPTDFFNGDFSLKNLGGKALASRPSIAGWYYHGGSGNGYQDGNGYLILDLTHPSKVHNRFVIPLKANKIKFQYKIVQAATSGKLVVSLGSTDLKSIDLNNIADWTEGEIDVTQYRGKVRTLGFQLFPELLNAVVYITNISIDEQSSGGADPVPSINSFAPKSAATDTEVILTGANFTGASAVSFGGEPAKSFSVVSPTSIKAVVGEGASGNVTVVTATGTASLAGFTFQPAANCQIPVAPVLTFGAPDCSTATVLTGGTTASLSFTSGGVAAYSAMVSKYPYGSANLVLSSPCQSTGDPVSAVNLQPGMIYRWNMFAYGASDCSSCRSALSDTYYFSLPPVISASGTSITQDHPVTLSVSPVVPGEGATADYKWMKNNVVVSEGAGVTTYTASSTGTYSLVIGYGGATDCPTAVTASSNSITLNFDNNCIGSEKPSSITSAPLGSSVVLSVAGGSLGTNANWKWYTGGCGTTTIGTGSSVTVIPDVPTLYYVRAEGDCGTTSCDSILVDTSGGCIKPTTPSYITQVNSTGTNNDPKLKLLIVGGSFGSAGTWRWYKGVTCGGAIFASGQSPELYVDPNEQATYSVRAEGSCDTSACVFTTVSPCPRSVLPDSIAQTKNGNGVLLKLAGGSLAPNASWLWRKGSCSGPTVSSGRIDSILVNPTETTTYYVSAVGCFNSDCISTTVLVIQPPLLSSFTPATAQTGTSVLITGTDLDRVSVVTFGGTPAASFKIVSATSISAVVGAGRSGDIVVTNSKGTASLPNFKFVFSIPADNFKISATSATCKGLTNGSIHIDAVKVQDYAVQLTAPWFSKVFSFSDTLTVSNLQAGTYHVVVTLPSQPDFLQADDLVITEPPELSVYTTVNARTNELTLSLSGGGNYYIQLNNQVYTTTANTFIIPLTGRHARLTVTTDKECQGIIQKMISAGQNVAPYPNPFQDKLSVDLGNRQVAVLKVTITRVSDFKMVYTSSLSNPPGIVTLGLSALEKGIYVLNLTFDNEQQSFKIIKQ